MLETGVAQIAEADLVERLSEMLAEGRKSARIWVRCHSSVRPLR